MYLVRNEILKSLDSLQEYQSIAKDKIDVLFPIKYLQQGVVRVFKNKFNQIIGGYVIINKGELRTIQSLPSSDLIPYPLEEIIEVTGFWLDPILRSGIYGIQIWPYFARDLCTQKNKKYFIYAYGIHSKNLQRLYSYSRPKIIYKGKVKKLIGNTCENYESVEISKCNFAKYFPLIIIAHYIRKLHFKQKLQFKNNKAISSIMGRL